MLQLINSHDAKPLDGRLIRCWTTLKNLVFGVLERKVGPKNEETLSRSDIRKKNVRGKILRVGKNPEIKEMWGTQGPWLPIPKASSGKKQHNRT